LILILGAQRQNGDETEKHAAHETHMKLNL
jgi:hypothetical protein